MAIRRLKPPQTDSFFMDMKGQSGKFGDFSSQQADISPAFLQRFADAHRICPQAGGV
jgi:hypothetical protein